METNDTAIALAREMFGRVRANAAMGTFGIAVVLATHEEHMRWLPALTWTAAALATFLSRMLYARYALRRISQVSNPYRLIDLEALLCALTGIAWSASLYVFDSGAQDYLFYLRLLILAAALAFTTGSLSVFMRIFGAYALGLLVPALYFVWTRDYIMQAASLTGSALAYWVMISVVAASNSKRFRFAVANHNEVLALSDKLRRTLDTEQRLREQMSRLARVDDLTGLFNRRATLEHLTTELSRCHRFRLSLAVTSMDVDRFKEINDTHGHAAGDQVLRSIGEVLRKGTRDVDLPGRMGGEEFLILMPHLEAPGAIAAADRIRRVIEQREVAAEEKRLKVTVSCGVALFRIDDTVETILARADDALYLAKRNGRNRCEMEQRSER